MKNVIRILGIAIVLVLIAQLVVMFMPFFDFTDMVKPTKKEPNPKTEYTLQDYVWMDTEKMDKQFFKKLIDDYNVNDHAEGLALTFGLGCVVVILNLLNFANSFNKLVTFRAGLINVLTHAISGFWCYIAIDAYLTSAVLTLPQANQEIYMISLNLIYVATALVVLRLVVNVVSGIVASNKARAARIAARQAA